MDWRPIDTAPRNGDAILACDARTLDGFHQVVCWDVDSMVPRTEYRWCTADGPAYHENRFTHWMPLPPPPASEEGDDGAGS